MRRLPVDTVRATLLMCITDHLNVQQLFDRVYEIISLPMICFDPSFSLIAYSFPRPFYYPHWEWLADRGSASREVILEYDYLSTQEEMVRSRGSILFDKGTTSGFAQYCGAVMNGEQLLAYCGIIAEDAERSDVRDVNDILIKALSVIMRQNLLDDDADRSVLHDSVLSKQQIEHLSRRCAGNYLFVSATCASNQKSTLQFTRSILFWKGFRMISSFCGDEILYILAGAQNSYMERESFLNALRELADNHGLVFGLSDYFNDPSGIPAHRQQSIMALSFSAVSDEKKTVSLFTDHYSDYVSQCALEYYGTEHCLCSDIQKLSDEDKSRGTENLRTLLAWFRSGMNNAKAASELGIHQATMINRIKHIASITGCDPAEHFLTLMLELELYNAAEAVASHAEKR